MTFNPSNQVTVEARILEVGHNLGMGRDALMKLIKTTYEQEGRPGLGVELRKLQARYRTACKRMEKQREKDWFEDQRDSADEAKGVTRLETRFSQAKARERQSLGYRLNDVLSALGLMSTVSSGMVARQSRSSDSPIPRTGEQASEVFERRALLLIRAAEAEWDRLRFGGSDVRETTDERNARLIREYEGFTSWEVAFMDPSMGHPTTIERIRREAGRSRKDGRFPMQKAA